MNFFSKDLPFFTRYVITTLLIQDSEKASGLSLNDNAVDDSRIGGSWDDAKRFFIESRKQDLEISRDIERVSLYILSYCFM